jgi:hypothetical protein
VPARTMPNVTFKVHERSVRRRDIWFSKNTGWTREYLLRD